VDVNKSDTTVQEFTDLVGVYNYRITNFEVTRETSATATCIDNFLVKFRYTFYY